MIDLNNEQQAVDQVEADQVELEVFNSLLDGDVPAIRNHRAFFSIKFMEDWAKELQENSRIL